MAEGMTALDLATARDILLHPGGHARSLLALASDVVVAELDRRGEAITRVRALHEGGHECPGDEDNCGWWPVGDCPTLWALNRAEWAPDSEVNRG